MPPIDKLRHEIPRPRSKLVISNQRRTLRKSSPVEGPRRASLPSDSMQDNDLKSDLIFFMDQYANGLPGISEKTVGSSSYTRESAAPTTCAKAGCFWLSSIN